MWEIKLQEFRVKWNVDDNNNINFAAYLGGKVIGLMICNNNFKKALEYKLFRKSCNNRCWTQNM